MPHTRLEQTTSGWVPIANLYAKYIDPFTRLYAQHALNLLPVKKGDHVLDVAAGAGALSLKAARLGATVTAIDFTPSLVTLLKKRAAEANLQNLTVAIMDGQNLDFDAESFDAAFSVFGLMLFPRRDRGFQELKRVLKPQHPALVVTWDAPPRNEWLSTFRTVIQTAFPKLPATKPPTFLELADTKRLKAEMSQAGFTNVKVSSWENTNVWQDAEAAWLALAKANPIFEPLIKKIGDDGEAKLHQTFLRLLKERYGNGPVELKATAHFALGIA